MMVPIFKGEKPFDAAAVKEATAGVHAGFEKAFAAFTEDSKEGPPETRAKPEIWTDPDGFKQEQKNAMMALEAVAASTDEASFKQAFRCSAKLAAAATRSSDVPRDNNLSARRFRKLALLVLIVVLGGFALEPERAPAAHCGGSADTPARSCEWRAAFYDRRLPESIATSRVTRRLIRKLPSGGKPLKTPVGIVYPPNLTPDPETGLGRWTPLDFLNATMRGLSRPDVITFRHFPIHPMRQCGPLICSIFALISPRWRR